MLEAYRPLARVLHLLFALLASLLVYWLIWSISYQRVGATMSYMSRRCFWGSVLAALSVGFFVHWVLDFVIGVP